MPHEMLDYGYFKPGTYWIYQDSVSGAIDSVWVYDAYYNIGTLPENNSNGLNAGIYDYYVTKTTSSFYNSDYYYWSNSSWTSSVNNYKSILWREKISQGSVLQTILMTNKFIVGDKTYPYTQDGDITFLQELNSYKMFTAVKVFNDSQNSTENNSNTNFFYLQKHFCCKTRIA